MKQPFECFKSKMEAALPQESGDDDGAVSTQEQLREVADPFGQDWSWLDPALEGEQASAPIAERSVPTTGDRTKTSSIGQFWRTSSGRKRVWQIGAATAAAGLLGFLLRPIIWSGPSAANPLWLTAQVEQESPAAGPGQPKTFRLESPRDGFLTVIATHSAVAPADTHIEPEPAASETVQVKAYQPVSYTLKGRVPAESVMFVVTQTPSDAALRRGIRQEAKLPSDPDAMMKVIYKHLRQSGYGWAACGMTDVH